MAEDEGVTVEEICERYNAGDPEVTYCVKFGVGFCRMISHPARMRSEHEKFLRELTSEEMEIHKAHGLSTREIMRAVKSELSKYR